MKIIFEKVSFRNFGSYGSQPTEIDLNQGLSTLILGRNLDAGKDGESGNGSGKSFSIQATIFALYGKGVDKLKTDEYVNLRNGKNLEVNLWFSKGDTKYQIIRGRKPNKLVFLADGIDITKDSMKNTDEDIEKVVGIPHDLFIRSVFMSPHIMPFMEMTPAEQRNFMENILSLDVLVERAEALKNTTRKDLQDSLKLIRRDIENAESNNEKIYASIESAQYKSEAFEARKAERISSLEKEIANIILPTEEDSKMIDALESLKTEKRELSGGIDEAKAHLSELNRQKTSYGDAVGRIEEVSRLSTSFDEKQQERTGEASERLKSLPSYEEIERIEEWFDKIDEHNDAIRDLLSEKKELIKESERNEKEHSKLNEELISLKSGICHACKQEHFDEMKVLDLEQNIDILTGKAESIALRLTSIEDEIEVKNGAIERLEKRIEKSGATNKSSLRVERDRLEAVLGDVPANPYREEMVALIEKHGEIKDIEEKILSLDKDIEEIASVIDDACSSLNDIDKEISEVQENMRFKTISEINSVESSKDRLEAELKRAKEEENAFESSIDEYKSLLTDISDITEQEKEIDNALTHTNYLIKLLTDPKSFIRKNIVDRYIPYLNKKIIGYGEKLGLLHVASINADMTVDIEYLGKDVSVFMMSRGERLRLNVATSLAFKDLMETLGKSFNILLVDELLDGSSDTYGMNAIFDLIREHSDDVFIVSHRDEFKDSVDRVARVTKKNGFSDFEILSG